MLLQRFDFADYNPCYIFIFLLIELNKNYYKGDTMAQKTPEDYARELIKLYRDKKSAEAEENLNIGYKSQNFQTSNKSEFEDGVGGLIVNATTIRRLYPVEGALVTVFTGNPDSMQIVKIDTTNESGKTDVFNLKTPLKSESQQSDNGGKVPYADYNVSVRCDGYVEQIIMNVPIFSGVISVQGADLTPVTAAGKNTSPQIINGTGKYDL